MLKESGSQNDFSEIVTQIISGIKSVLQGENLSASDFMKIYKYIYEYCTESEKAHNSSIPDEDFNIQGLYGQLIFDKIEKLLETHFEEIQKYISSGFYPLINIYLEEWKKCKKHASSVDSICSYLNRNWVRQQRTQSTNKICGFYQLAIIKWTTKVFYSFHIRLIDEALNLVHKDRLGEIVDLNILKDFCHHLQELKQDNLEIKQNITCDNSNLSNFPNLASNTTSNTTSNTNIISTQPTTPSIIPSVGTTSTFSTPVTSNLIYNTEFHSRFMHMTENFYVSFSREKFEQNSPIDYLKQLKITRDTELLRAKTYINPNISDDLKRLIHEICISPYLSSLYTAFRNLIKEESSSDINFFYNLIQNIENVVSNIKSNFLDEFKEILLNKVNDLGVIKDDPVMFMNSIFEMFRKYDSFVADSFDGNVQFEELKIQAYSQLLNHCFDKYETNTIHETMALYFHTVMTSMHDLAVNFRSHQNFIDFMRCLELIRDKDAFKKCYKEFLASRLILNISLSYKTEVEVVQYFTSIRDDEFAIHLKKMLADVDSFGIVNEQFRKFLGNLVIPLIPYFKCIFHDAWPVSYISDCKVPHEIDALYTNFKRFYPDKYKSRNLKIYEHLSQVDLEMPFPSGTYNVSMNGLHASVILLFRYKNVLTYDDIFESTGIKNHTLRIVIESLLGAELLLACNLTGSRSDIVPDTEFRLNHMFNSHTKFISIDMNNHKFKESAPRMAVESNKPKISELAIQACIVRLLKHDRQIKASELVSRVLKTLKAFDVKEKDIKPNITNLISRDFLYFQHETDSYIYIE